MGSILALSAGEVRMDRPLSLLRTNQNRGKCEHNFDGSSGFGPGRAVLKHNSTTPTPRAVLRESVPRKFRNLFRKLKWSDHIRPASGGRRRHCPPLLLDPRCHYIVRPASPGAPFGGRFVTPSPPTPRPFVSPHTLSGGQSQSHLEVSSNSGVWPFSN